MTGIESLHEALEVARHAEKVQALVYRGMAALAEAEGEVELAQRLHDLHADEQHHLSRLTARILELGRQPHDLSEVRPVPASLVDWEGMIRDRERREIELYEALLQRALDSQTRDLVESILAVERRHAEELGGKWTLA